MKLGIINIKSRWILNILLSCLLVFVALLLNNSKTMMVINQAVGNPIYKGNQNNNSVAIECNVVWGNEHLIPMLNILKERNIKITFFLGGKWAEDNIQLAKLIQRYGHEIGNHGYSHKHHSGMSLEGNLNEIKKAEDAILKATGIKTTLFAPPYGEFDNQTLRAANNLNYRTMMWSLDTIDWRGDGVDKIISRITKNLHDDAIILMHPTDDTVKALPTILDYIVQNGYNITKVSDIIDTD